MQHPLDDTWTGLIDDRYALRRMIGRGGMGEVWLADDLVLRRAVAVKLLHTQLTLDEVAQSRFQREVRAAASLNHPRTAYLMSLLIRQLLDTEPASSWSIQQALRLAGIPGIEAAINRLRTDCVALTERIAKVGLTHEWGYDYTAGKPLDPDRQEAWASCDPDASVSFLVAPAYLVGGRIYGRQIVYTV
ncbi:hypothetical protein ACFCX7_26085 [Streptomyces microflavus]|uniref:hypothetical protein n=1 Tax=Streptomyces microflavus TaxID=1919 RepID=UPI0035DB12BC